MKIETRASLIELMKHFHLPLVAAEVGVAEGIWSIDLLQQGIEKLYLIDIWERVPFIEGCASFDQEWHDKNYDSVVERTKPYKEKVIILKGFSYKMANQIPDESLGLVYLDAAHDYNGVKADIEIYWPKLVTGGILAFHDYANPEYGVWRAVKYFAHDNEREINMLKEDGELVNIGCYIRK
jgi:methyltransferase family protein